jgi:hypothetical protein
MRPHRLFVSVVAPLFAVVLAIGGLGPAWAASQHPADAPARAALAVHETKVTLPETSIDGPALSSVFVPNGTSESVIAWTGSDAAHHLNVETSSDGLQFGNKRTLNETSPYRPDVALSGVGGAVVVAWTGSDPNHSLNVLYDVYGSPKKLTLLHENSISAPAIKVGPGMYLAWTGTDANHSLNIMPLSVTASGVAAGQKVVLSQFSSNAGPHLARRGANTLVLNWTSRALQVRLALSQDGVHFSSAELPETSAFAPDTNSLEPYIGVSGREWIGWTGTDPAHHLNLQWTESFPQFTNLGSTKTVLGETALGGPALDYNAGLQVAWTGTDSFHHLNVARFAYS